LQYNYKFILLNDLQDNHNHNQYHLEKAFFFLPLLV
jgi:hypothetical protein